MTPHTRPGERERERERGPGVPEAVPRGVQRLAARLGAETVDRIWIFPPLVSGRRESGLLAVSRYTPGDDPERRVLLALRYQAERTGRGLTLESDLEEHGEAPVDRLPRVMEGVVRRAGSELGDPREVEVGGDPLRLWAFLADFDPELLDPDLLHPGPPDPTMQGAAPPAPATAPEVAG
ncbi:MAG: hypothetical protein RQ751_06870 [Longimicrobiales bacterium]|nr:hypothetical protein [Longimicrobiales bacterium]